MLSAVARRRHRSTPAVAGVLYDSLGSPDDHQLVLDGLDAGNARSQSRGALALGIRGGGAVQRNDAILRSHVEDHRARRRFGIDNAFYLVREHYVTGVRAFDGAV